MGPTTTHLSDEPVEIAPWDGRRVPVTLLGGYLGAGKTTVVNHLLARTDRPIAVLVNDVGSIGIDYRLIARRSGDALELTDGCVCCSLRQGLAHAFDQLRTRPSPPDHVVIELSGVADPGRVVPWANSIGFRLDGVVVLADAELVDHWLDHSTVGPLVQRQFDAADLILLSKIDLVDDDGSAAEATIRTVSHAPIVALDGPDAVAGILDLATRRSGATATPPPTLFDAHRTLTLPLPDPVEPSRLDSIVDELVSAQDGEVIRAKGIARSLDGSLHLIQVVGHRRTITPLSTAEREPPTELVVILSP